MKEIPEYSTELYENKKQKSDCVIAEKVLKMVASALAAHSESEWVNEKLYGCLQGIAVENDLKNSQVLWPVRVALSGKLSTPVGASEILELLGKEEALCRLEKSLLRF